MKKKILGKLVVGLGVFLGMSGVALASSAAEASTLYRAYNPNTGEHLYTQNANEIPFVVSKGWRSEGTAWEAPSKGVPVYRVFNPNNGGDHHYSMNKNEVDNLKSKGWRYEGISWQSGGSTPVYRLYNPNAKTGTHHFTTLVAERDNLKRAGWRYEGVAFYSGKDSVATPTQPSTPAPFDVAKTEREISQKLFAKINQHRVTVGLQKLDGSDILNRAVTTRANDLHTLYEHRRPDGTDISTYVNNQLGYSQFGSCGGENIWGATYRTDRDTPDSMAEAIINSWKKSPAHRSLLESNVSNEGAIGIKLLNPVTTYYDISAVFLTGINSSK